MESIYIEMFVEFGLGVLILFLRYFARWKAVGFKRWQGDDFAAVLALVLWTVAFSMSILNQIYGSNVDVTDAMIDKLSPEQIERKVFGSKCVLVGRNCYVALAWVLKGCMLCFYYRITALLEEQRVIKWMGVVCVASYFAVLITIWAQCIPLYKNWEIVPAADRCPPGMAYFAVFLILNVSTDIAILCIPLPWFRKLRTTIWHKIGIGALLCSGVFLVVIAILRNVLSLQNIQVNSARCIWATRETFVGIIVTNAVAIKPLFTRGRRGSLNNSQRMAFDQKNYTPDNMRAVGEKPDPVFLYTSTSSADDQLYYS